MSLAVESHTVIVSISTVTTRYILRCTLRLFLPLCYGIFPKAWQSGITEKIMSLNVSSFIRFVWAYFIVSFIADFSHIFSFVISLKYMIILLYKIIWNIIHIIGWFIVHIASNIFQGIHYDSLYFVVTIASLN